MKALPWDRIQIVGLNGSARGDCGYALPIGRYTDSDERHHYFKLTKGQSEGADVETLHSLDKIREEAVQGRVTLFLDQPIEPPRDSDPVVVYVKKPLVDTLGGQLPVSFHEKAIAWKEAGRSFWVTCLAKSRALHILDSWAQTTLQRLDHLLKLALTQNHPANHQEIERLAQMAIFAAHAPSLRERAFVRLGAAIQASAQENTEERLDNLYHFLVATEFPALSKPDFLTELSAFRRKLAPPAPPSPEPSRASSLRERARNAQALHSLDAIREECARIAKDFPIQSGGPDRILAALADKSVSNSEPLVTDEQTLAALASDPLIIQGRILRFPETSPPSFRLWDFLDLVVSRPPDPGSISARLHEKLHKIHSEITA